MRRGSVALVLGAVLASSCQPWYRDDLRRGRRVGQRSSIETLLGQAQGARNKGNEARAIEYAHAALARDTTSGPAHLMLASLLRDAGRHAEARLVARRGLEVSGMAGLRPILIESYLADDLTSAALDLVDPATMQHAAAAGIPGASELARAELLAATDPGKALTAYAAWLDAYGVPDHPILRAAGGRIVSAGWADERTRAVFSALLDEADREAGAGRADFALALYSHTFPKVPGAVRELHWQSFLRAAAAVKEPAAVAPLAYELAVQGDVALEAGRLGPAIRAYRRALALAPWWSAAHDNLAILFDMTGRAEEARLQRAWVTRLQEKPTALARKPAPAADSGSAWSVARAVLPADVKLIAGVDVAALRETSLHASLYRLLTERNRHVKEVLALMKSSCGIDAAAIVDHMIVAVDERGPGIVFAQVKGVDERSATECVAGIATAAGVQVTVERRARGAATVVELATRDPDSNSIQSVYAAWYGSVIAIATDATDRGLLDKMIGGNGALDASVSFLAKLTKVDKSVLGWAVVRGPEPTLGGTAERVFAQVYTAAGGYKFQWFTTMASPAEAQSGVAGWRQQVKLASASAAPEQARLFGALHISASGADVVVTAKFTEADLLAALKLLQQ